MLYSSSDKDESSTESNQRERLENKISSLHHLIYGIKDKQKEQDETIQNIERLIMRVNEKVSNNNKKWNDWDF